jgi:hypothetical protein
MMPRRSRKECALDRAIDAAAARATELDQNWKSAATASKNAKHGEIVRSRNIAGFLMRQSLIALRDHDRLTAAKQNLNPKEKKS